MEPNETPVTPTPTTEAPAPAQKTSYGALLGLVVVVLAIAAGAMYFLTTRVNDLATMSAEGLTEQSDSTDAAAIEADLSAESPDDFEKDLDAAMAELDASFTE